MDLSAIAGFALTSLAIELTPGPNMVWLATLALSDGRRAGLAAVAGVAVGLGLLGAAAGLGLGAVVAASPALYQSLRWAGVAYLLWLAWQGWQGGEDAEDMGAAGASPWVFFRRGVITNILNPKAMLFYITILPAFLGASGGVTANLGLGAVYVSVATGVHAAIVLGAAQARGLLLANAPMTIVRRALALLLVGVAIWLAAKG